MEYIKLIAIQINDFSSTITFEKNYDIKENEIYNSKKNELQADGLICILANVNSSLNL